MKNNLLILFINCLMFNQLVFCQLEGNDCKLEDGSNGICKILPECPSQLEAAQQGKRSATSSRCGFEGLFEIVCCPIPINIPQKVGVRPSESACNDFDNEVPESLNDLSRHILAGIDVLPGEFPYMVALGYNDDQNSDKNKTVIKYICGGSIISSNYVLTAAHCVSNEDNFVPVLVRAGSVNLEENDKEAREIRISNIIPHEDFDRINLSNDIAVLKLTEHFKWSTTIKPICLTTKAFNWTENFPNVNIVVTGWGTTSINGDTTSNLLKTPSLKLVPYQECAKSYGNFRRIADAFDDKIVCAIDSNSTRGSDACHGDSGGPLLMLPTSKKDVLIGITSFGQSCGSTIPGVYTSVYTFLDWIEDIVWPDFNSNEEND